MQRKVKVMLARSQSFLTVSPVLRRITDRRRGQHLHVLLDGALANCLTPGMARIRSD
jgi:hypothetical protein